METIIKRYMIEGSKGKTKTLSYLELAKELSNYTTRPIYAMTLWRLAAGQQISEYRAKQLREIADNGKGWARDFAHDALAYLGGAK